MSGKVSDPGSAWFGGGERSSSGAGPGRNVRLVATAVAAFVSVLGLALFLHLYVCHVRRRNRRRAAAAAAALPAAAAPKVGLDPSAIAALPTAPYGKVGDAAGCTECAICLGAMQEADAVRVLPACRHVFDVACIDQWLASSSSCPVCRAGVEPPPQPLTAERCVHVKQDGVKEEVAAGSSAPARALGASLMKMLSRERPSPRRQPGVHAVEMEDLESQLPRPPPQQLQH
ncbi:RING-H2 finger protein ATL39-like [Oryza brachyantha]|uniref:RING-H2 finger protein ATL39-like n=1 Tax=Oryza brachyantha TaxID=4533 RepID=UPI001AD97247|nr:RING-H2 finger protein ATL39-like [Oryza brachyantha]